MGRFDKGLEKCSVPLFVTSSKLICKGAEAHTETTRSSVNMIALNEDRRSLKIVVEEQRLFYRRKKTETRMPLEIPLVRIRKMPRSRRSNPRTMKSCLPHCMSNEAVTVRRLSRISVQHHLRSAHIPNFYACANHRPTANPAMAMAPIARPLRSTRPAAPVKGTAELEADAEPLADEPLAPAAEPAPEPEPEPELEPP